jgi:hypothetical protein
MSKLLLGLAVIGVQLIISTECYAQKTGYNPTDLNWYLKNLQREIATAKEQLKKFKEDKGYDPQAVKLIDEASSEIRNIEDKLQQLQTKTISTSTALLTMSVIKEKSEVVKDDLVSLGALIPSGPKNFPERCVIYKVSIPERGEEIAKKEGLEQRIGQLEPMGYANHLVLSAPDSNNPNKVIIYQLDEKMGLVGSAEPNASQIAKHPTPPNAHVTAWVDAESKKVMCVSQPIPVK